MPDACSDVWDRVETYAVHMLLARRLKITFIQNLKLIISLLDHQPLLVLIRLILVASTRQAP
jgi:hypothetical protein